MKYKSNIVTICGLVVLNVISIFLAAYFGGGHTRLDDALCASFTASTFFLFISLIAYIVCSTKE